MVNSGCLLAVLGLTILGCTDTGQDEPEYRRKSSGDASLSVSEVDPGASLTLSGPMVARDVVAGTGGCSGSVGSGGGSCTIEMSLPFDGCDVSVTWAMGANGDLLVDEDGSPALEIRLKTERGEWVGRSDPYHPEQEATPAGTVHFVYRALAQRDGSSLTLTLDQFRMKPSYVPDLGTFRLSGTIHAHGYREDSFLHENMAKK